MDIRFPHLGIILSHVGRSIDLHGFQIMYYGMAVALGFVAGTWLARMEAKRTGQDPDLYLDFLLWMMIPAILGARAYYVIFSWDYYSKNPLEILNLRHGGLGIAGGVIVGVIVIWLFSRKKKVSPALMFDTITPGLLLGQIIGRWGNFFNREAFGRYTDNLFAMQIPLGYFEQTGRMSELEGTGILDHLQGKAMDYIQVHPTFLYEGMWNLALLLFIWLFFRYRKKFDGEVFCVYMIGYGLGRFLIESLRVDQLQIGDSGIAVTQVVCLVIFALGWVIIYRKRKGTCKTGATML